MKKLSSLLIGSVLLFPGLLSAEVFEGKVAMKLTDPNGKTIPMNFSIKEGLSRIDIEAGGANPGMIMDSAKKEMTILIPQQRMYMVQPMTLAAAAATAGVPESTADVSFEKASDTEKILGYDCVKFVAKTKDGTTEIWTTDQLGAFPGLGMGGGPGGMMGRRGGAPAANNPAWAQALAGKSFFPLRVVTHNAAGKETFRMEASSVEKQSLPASLFAPPEGWQNLSDMMKGMGGMPGMPGMRGGN
ncbi:MAG TPA: DUF4412 domain-containing protein [Opitutaceae bacterium]|nr:DUF4412 domain-containing protein [Opitutaceae bacterium]